MTDEREPRNTRQEDSGSAADRPGADAASRRAGRGVNALGTDAAGLDTDPRETEMDNSEFHPMHAPEERETDIEGYNVAPPTMPPSPAGANAEIGGEAASSRRNAGLPPDLARDAEHTPGRATPGREPFLGYDSLGTDDILGWIEDADPEVDELRSIRDYERTHDERDPILDDCDERIRKLGGG